MLRGLFGGHLIDRLRFIETFFILALIVSSFIANFSHVNDL